MTGSSQRATPVLPAGHGPAVATPTPRTRNRKRRSSRGRGAAPSPSASPPPRAGHARGRTRGPRRPRSGGRKKDREQRRQDQTHGRQRPLTRPVRAGAGGEAVRERPPRLRRRQSAGFGRTSFTGRPWRPGLIIPPPPQGPRPGADSPGGCRCRQRPAWPAGRPRARTHQGAPGTGHGPPGPGPLPTRSAPGARPSLSQWGTRVPRP